MLTAMFLVHICACAEDEEQPPPYSTFNWVGRGLMVSSLILFFLRIFHFYELSEQLGPKVHAYPYLSINKLVLVQYSI